MLANLCRAISELIPLKKATFSILFAFLFIALSVISRAETPTPTSEEEALQQKLDRLNEEVAATKARLAVIRGARVPPAVESDKKKEESTQATSVESQNFLSSFIRQVNLWNSVFNKDYFKQPAEISYVRPGSGPSSFAIDAGVRVEMQSKYFSWGETISPAIGVDYHRSTNPAALKDLFQAGGQFEDTIGFAATSGVLLDNVADISYKIDRVRRLDSLNASITLYPVVTFGKMGLPVLAFLNTDNYHRSLGMRWRWEPFIGATYEDTVQTGAAVKSGHHGILDYGVEFLIYPFFSTKLGKQIEITASYKGWEPIDPTGVFGWEHTSSYYEADLTYLFISPNPITVGEMTSRTVDWGLTFKYQNGTNLETGDKNLDLLTLALTGRF